MNKLTFLSEAQILAIKMLEKVLRLIHTEKKLKIEQLGIRIEPSPNKRLLSIFKSVESECPGKDSETINRKVVYLEGSYRVPMQNHFPSLNFVARCYIYSTDKWLYSRSSLRWQPHFLEINSIFGKRYFIFAEREERIISYDSLVVEEYFPESE
jgi:hypothetical protein